MWTDVLRMCVLLVTRCSGKCHRGIAFSRPPTFDPVGYAAVLDGNGLAAECGHHARRHRRAVTGAADGGYRHVER